MASSEDLDLLMMPPKKTPTSASSLSGSHVFYPASPHLTAVAATVPEPLAKRVWHRILAMIQKMHSRGASLKPSTTPSPPATRLPLEVVEMIIAYLIYDIRSLRACSMTCHPWYTAAVPHLHHALLVDINSLDRKFQWSDPIRNMHVLGLLPLVKLFSIRRGGHSKVGFSPELFDRHTLRQFSALTGIRTLWIDDLDIPSFMPMIRQYFGHLFPTVQFLTLREPKGSHRQNIYFIGMFQHLEDLWLLYDDHRVNLQDEPADDLMLIPPSAPPLRGRLFLKNFTRVGLLEDMIDLFGGIRFRGMDLFNVDGMPLLLGACAKTLETLRLYPDDPHGEFFFRNAPNLQLKVSQLDYPFRASIYHGTSRFGNYGSRRGLWIVRRVVNHRTRPLISSSMCSRPSHPLHSPSSLSFTGTTTSVVCNWRGTRTHLNYARYHKLRVRRNPHDTTDDSNYYARCIKCGTFSWCCVQTFWARMGSTRCEC